MSYKAINHCVSFPSDRNHLHLYQTKTTSKYVIPQCLGPINNKFQSQAVVHWPTTVNNLEMGIKYDIKR